MVLTRVVPLWLGLFLACHTKPPSSIPVPPALQACSSDQDCLVVSTTCNGCCQQGAVSRAHAADYDDARAKGCKGFSGAVCECMATPATAQCISGLCTLVETTHGP